jgi:NADH dehydrogenase FAD-containing subunit
LKRLVLAGAGHAHALVLLELVRRPLPGTEVVVVSPQALAPYSGMVQRQLRLSDGDELGYDVLSLNLGSTLRPPPTVHATLLALRPLAELRSRYEALLQQWSADASTAACTVTAVGAGAAGFESLLAVLARLRALRPDRPVHGRLVGRGAALLPDLSACAQRAARNALRAAGVTLELGAGGPGAIDRAGDLVLWATGAEAHAWPRDPTRRGALAVDDAGFVRIDASLRSVSHPQVFAAGDCARFEPAALPKAGVYAVRMGPVLAHNLRAALGADGGFERYRPQRRFLALLATGDGRAIASRGAFGGAGAWAWRWKDRIDRGFIGRFRDATATPTAEPLPLPDPPRQPPAAGTEAAGDRPR